MEIIWDLEEYFQTLLAFNVNYANMYLIGVYREHLTVYLEDYFCLTSGIGMFVTRYLASATLLVRSVSGWADLTVSGR